MWQYAELCFAAGVFILTSVREVEKGYEWVNAVLEKYEFFGTGWAQVRVSLRGYGILSIGS